MSAKRLCASRRFRAVTEAAFRVSMILFFVTGTLFHGYLLLKELNICFSAECLCGFAAAVLVAAVLCR